jgi:hypothetical protein
MGRYCGVGFFFYFNFLINAMVLIRGVGVLGLALANADDKTTILRLQQKAAVIDEIRTTLGRYIIAADVQETAGSFA